MSRKNCALTVRSGDKVAREYPAGDALKRPGISRNICNEIIECIARDGINLQLITRDDVLRRNKSAGPIRKRFHSYTFCGTGCYGKQVARTRLRSSRTGCRDGKGSETRDGDTMRTQYSVRKRRCCSAARRKCPCRCDPDVSSEAGDRVSKRVTRCNLYGEWNPRPLPRDVTACRRFHKEVVERPSGDSDCSRSRCRDCP